MLDFLLEQHTWYSLFKVHWMLLTLILSYFYVKKLIQSPLHTVSAAQKFYFFTAIAVLLLLKATPIDVIAIDYLFSVHVLQLSLIYFIVIPLLILSLPITFIRKHVWHHRMRFTFNVLAYPWLTLVAFNGLLSIYLIPSVFNTLHASSVASFLAQVILFINAVFMWWVIIQPLPEIRGFSYLLRALYIFLASIALFPIGFFYVIDPIFK